MDELVELWERPIAEEIYMLAGWYQWADAGNVSSGLPQYLIQHTGARQIGEIESESFYLFQVPGLHHLIRPQIKLQDGYRQTLSSNANEVFYTGNDKKGLVIFLGEEPHLHADRYCEAVLDIAEALRVKRLVAVGGVYGPAPYDKEREISCVYSLPPLKEELTRYAVKFSDYEGGATIGAYLMDRAERRDIESITFYAFVPAYDFAQVSNLVQTMRIENDFKAWYDLMRRFNHMTHLDIDLGDLERHSYDLIASMDAQVDELNHEIPDLEIERYLREVAEDFDEQRFVPLSDVWEKGLQDLFNDLDDLDADPNAPDQADEV